MRFKREPEFQESKIVALLYFKIPFLSRKIYLRFVHHKFKCGIKQTITTRSLICHQRLAERLPSFIS
jgi:hypothetical protein